MKRGFNNKPKSEEDGDEAPASTWWIDQDAWDDVRSEQASRMLLPKPVGYMASCHDGYVVSLNYACEVVARQRRMV